MEIFKKHWLSFLFVILFLFFSNTEKFKNDKMSYLFLFVLVLLLSLFGDNKISGRCLYFIAILFSGLVEAFNDVWILALMFGIYYFVLAILSWFGRLYLVSKKYETETWYRVYQRDIAFPYAIIGIGFTLMGLKDQTIFQYIGLISLFIASILRDKVNKRYDI